jgi:hypothetical protein
LLIDRPEIKLGLCRRRHHIARIPSDGRIDISKMNFSKAYINEIQPGLLENSDKMMKVAALFRN